MRNTVSLTAVALVLAACTEGAERTFTAPVFSSDAAGSAGNNYVTQLTGDEEVPPRVTDAHGVATFVLSKDGESISYKLNVANIDNVVAAHIHIGPRGANGPVVVFLAGPYPPGGGPSNGRLSEGTFTSADFVGPLAGQPMSALVAAIEAGNTYVNVHTNDGVPPVNTGPGDFPGGEIRGQIDDGSGFQH